MRSDSKDDGVKNIAKVSKVISTAYHMDMDLPAIHKDDIIKAVGKNMDINDFNLTSLFNKDDLIKICSNNGEEDSEILHLTQNFS